MKRFVITLISCLLLIAGCHKEPSVEPQEESRIIFTERSGNKITAHYSDGSAFYFSVINDHQLHECECIGNRYEYYRNSLTIPSSIKAKGGDYYYDYYCTYTIVGIGDGASFGTRITTLVLPNTITRIGDHSFAHCASLRDFVFPERLASIGEGAFQGCRSLTTLSLPDSLESIGNSAFQGCSSLTTLHLPDSLENIGHGAFEGCSSLTSITIPGAIHSIGEGTFEGCSLATVTITATETIAQKAFAGAFKNCSQDSLSLVFSEGIKYIDCWAFGDCSSVTSITLPSSIRKIDYYVFAGCPLETIIIRQGIDSIGNDAFHSAFQGTSLVLPEGLKYIGRSAFEDCCITNCSCYAIVPPTLNYVPGYYGDYPFSFGLQAIYVPRESVEAYKTADGWRHYADIIYPIE